MSLANRQDWQWGRGAALWVVCVATLAPSSARADLVRSEEAIETQAPSADAGAAPGDAALLQVYRVTTTAAAEPVPALRHRLRARDLDLISGNAAPYYYRAMLALDAPLKEVREQHQDFDDWYSTTPLAELPRDQVRAALEPFEGQVMEALREATSRRSCDWQWDVENKSGPEIAEFLLQEVQESRDLARILAVRTRLALAERRFEDALDSIRMSYRLAEDVGQQPLLICDLVGVAIVSMANQQVLEFIAQPGAPNLYWALAELPPELFDLSDSIRVELQMCMRSFPSLHDAEQAQKSPEEWARVLAQATADFNRLNEGGLPQVQAAVAASTIMIYPGAKQRLIAGGMEPVKVEAMPAGQVLAIDTVREYRRIADELEKWIYVPYHIARQQPRPDPLPRHGAVGVIGGGYGRLIAELLVPAVEAARSAGERARWQLRAIQTVEALRMAAAVHGALPASLEELHPVPAPLNPATGLPYEYALEDGVATLRLPLSDGFRNTAWRIELQIEEKQP